MAEIFLDIYNRIFYNFPITRVKAPVYIALAPFFVKNRNSSAGFERLDRYEKSRRNSCGLGRGEKDERLYGFN